MQTSNLKTPKGRKAPNQVVIQGVDLQGFNCDEFKSYGYLVAKKIFRLDRTVVLIDRHDWYDTSKITARYRSQFLGEAKRVTKDKIDRGIYELTDLNPDLSEDEKEIDHTFIT